jgi:type VI secretion system Hcp family effector
MAGTYFLQLEGIEGQAADSLHDKWIELISFAHGTSQHVSIENLLGVSGQGEFAPFTFSHAVDKATPKLQLYCMNGTVINKAVFQYCRVVSGSATAVYEITLETVRVAKAEVKTIATESNAPLAQQPVETVELVAGRATWKATPIKPDGSKDGAIEASYDQVANK